MHLPIYYPEDVKISIVDGKERNDTTYHTIPAFSFLNQNGETITEKTFDSTIYLADFFFSTCPTMCPKMMTQLRRVDSATKVFKNFRIISHTVNPEHDSVAVLAQYAQLVHADGIKWMLVTGNKKDIYDVAMEGYKLAVQKDPRAPGGFLHSEMFVLVDKLKRIRGYYDGTDKTQVDKLINDIKILFAEFQSKSSSSSDIIQRH